MYPFPCWLLPRRPRLEYCEHGTLARYLQARAARTAALSARRVREFAVQLAAALAFIHEQGVPGLMRWSRNGEALSCDRWRKPKIFNGRNRSGEFRVFFVFFPAVRGDTQYLAVPMHHQLELQLPQIFKTATPNAEASAYRLKSQVGVCWLGAPQGTCTATFALKRCCWPGRASR